MVVVTINLTIVTAVLVTPEDREVAEIHVQPTPDEIEQESFTLVWDFPASLPTTWVDGVKFRVHGKDWVTQKFSEKVAVMSHTSLRVEIQMDHGFALAFTEHLNWALGPSHPDP